MLWYKLFFQFRFLLTGVVWDFSVCDIGAFNVVCFNLLGVCRIFQATCISDVASMHVLCIELNPWLNL